MNLSLLLPVPQADFTIESDRRGTRLHRFVIGWFMNAIGTEQQWADALKAEQKKLADVIESLRCLLRYEVISGEYNRSGRGEQ